MQAAGASSCGLLKKDMGRGTNQTFKPGKHRKILPQPTDAKFRPTDAVASFGIGVHQPLSVGVLV